VNWVAFAIVAWIALGLETGLRDALRLGSTSVAPSFVVPVAVYIALSTPPRTALWANIVLGLLLDLTWLLPRADGPQAHVIGPYALGMVTATQLVLAMRGLVIRKNILTHAVLSALAAAAMHSVVVAILTLRTIIGDAIQIDPTQQLFVRLLSSAATAATGLVLGFALLRLDPLMGLQLDRRGRVTR